MPNYTNRGVQCQRWFRIIMALSHRGYTIRELSDKFNVSVKTVYRDLKALEALELPLYTEPNHSSDYAREYIWFLDKHWIKRYV